jgi:hypothetical protein
MQSFVNVSPHLYSFKSKVYLFICGLCSDTVSISDYIMLNDMINEYGNGKDVEESSHGII